MAEFLMLLDRFGVSVALLAVVVAATYRAMTWLAPRLSSAIDAHVETMRRHADAIDVQSRAMAVTTAALARLEDRQRRTHIGLEELGRLVSEVARSLGITDAPAIREAERRLVAALRQHQEITIDLDSTADVEAL